MQPHTYLESLLIRVNRLVLAIGGSTERIADTSPEGIKNRMGKADLIPLVARNAVVALGSDDAEFSGQCILPLRRCAQANNPIRRGRETCVGLLCTSRRLPQADSPALCPLTQAQTVRPALFKRKRCLDPSISADTNSTAPREGRAAHRLAHV